jgi:hypothetical protein
MESLWLLPLGTRRRPLDESDLWMEMNMRKLLISAVVALTALTGTAAPTLADTVFRAGPGGVYVGPSYRDHHRYPRYHRDRERPRHASCRTRNERHYSDREHRWVTRATRVCYR